MYRKAIPVGNPTQTARYVPLVTVANTARDAVGIAAN